MVAAPARPSRTRRLFGWFGRHKITAVFTVLVLAFLLWFFGSWIVWDVQVHFERERFMSTDHKLTSFRDQIVKLSSPATSISHECSYTDNGAVFAIKSLGCVTSLKVTYKDVSRVKAERLTDEAKMMVARDGVKLNENNRTINQYAIATYGFKLNDINCAFTSTYYDDSVSTAQRYSGAPNTGLALFIAIDCSGPAKVAYFPIVD